MIILQEKIKPMKCLLQYKLIQYKIPVGINSGVVTRSLSAFIVAKWSNIALGPAHWNRRENIKLMRILIYLTINNIQYLGKLSVKYV